MARTGPEPEEYDSDSQDYRLRSLPYPTDDIGTLCESFPFVTGPEIRFLYKFEPVKDSVIEQWTPNPELFAKAARQLADQYENFSTGEKLKIGEVTL